MTHTYGLPLVSWERAAQFSPSVFGKTHQTAKGGTLQLLSLNSQPKCSFGPFGSSGAANNTDAAAAADVQRTADGSQT